MIGSVETIKEIPQPASVPYVIGNLFKPPPILSKPSENASTKTVSEPMSQPTAATEADCLPELRPIVDAEQRRSAKTAANLTLCSAAISGVEATLLHLTNRLNR
ncbi:EKA-like protein [Blumeria hordei DH14]|uniref:EKA-like protein n=1 Tax=Blumeria graminis f. sp. hordei (strain DH14) TaxID=546991 RepID=N1JFH4_BLUG1|nr:EKA-like protein [Blumeria hordei DH14]